MSAPTAARRVTPTAVRVLPADADRDTWLAARRRGIGSSDVAALVGATEYSTALHVYLDKHGQLVDEQNEPMLWGSILEEPVAREWARRNRSVIRRVGLVAHQAQPWMLATLDRQVLECPMNRLERENCAVEVKCRNAFTASKWRRDVPDDVLAQTVWQMRVTGYRHIHVAVLIGGSDYRQTVVRHDPELEAFIVGEATTFRDRHLLPGVPPAADLDRAEAYLELDGRLHPDRGGDLDGLELSPALHPGRVAEIDAIEAGDVDEYARLSKAKGTADRGLKRMRARLAELAAGARYVIHEGHLAYELQPRSKDKVDLQLLAERWPDAYAACVGQTDYHQIAIAREFRNV